MLDFVRKRDLISYAITQIDEVISHLKKRLGDGKEGAKIIRKLTKVQTSLEMSLEVGRPLDRPKTVL